MKATTISAFKRDVDGAVARVNEDREPLVILDEDGEQTAIVVPIHDYEALAETRHLLSTPANARRLQDAIAEAGRGIERTLDELHASEREPG